MRPGERGALPAEVQLRQEGYRRKVEVAGLLLAENGHDPEAALAFTQQCGGLWELALGLAQEPCGANPNLIPRPGHGSGFTCGERNVTPLCLSCQARLVVGWP